MATSMYTDWDLSQSAARVQDTLGGLPLDAQSFQAAAVSQLQQATTGAAAVADTAVSQSDQDAVAKYISMTDVMAQMNESANTNMYIAASLDKEIERVRKLDGSAKTGIYKVRQEHQYYSYMESYYNFVTRIMMFTLIVTLIMLCFVAVWRMGHITGGMFWTLTLILLALYAIVMMIAFQNAAYRRKNAWDKYYFKTSKDVRNAVELSKAGASCSA